MQYISFIAVFLTPLPRPAFILGCIAQIVHASEPNHQQEVRNAVNDIV